MPHNLERKVSQVCIYLTSSKTDSMRPSIAKQALLSSLSVPDEWCAGSLAMATHDTNAQLLWNTSLRLVHAFYRCGRGAC